MQSDNGRLLTACGVAYLAFAGCLTVASVRVAYQLGFGQVAPEPFPAVNDEGRKCGAIQEEKNRPLLVGFLARLQQLSLFWCGLNRCEQRVNDALRHATPLHDDT